MGCGTIKWVKWVSEIPRIVRTAPSLAQHLEASRGIAPKFSETAWDVMPDHRAKFHADLLEIINRLNKQTNRQTNSKLQYTRFHSGKMTQLTYKQGTETNTYKRSETVLRGVYSDTTQLNSTELNSTA